MTLTEKERRFFINILKWRRYYRNTEVPGGVNTTWEPWMQSTLDKLLNE